MEGSGWMPLEAGGKLFIGRAGTPVTEDDGKCGHGAREVAGGHACDAEEVPKEHEEHAATGARGTRRWR